jgi:hypothetical protein
VVEYRSNGRTAILSSARQVFYERQPFPNHNGGQLAFGPDGLLYIGLGDGGSGGDPNNNGQTFQTKLAKIWKLDVNRRGAQPQLVEYGLRNPWRFSFDRATGDLYIGDVGQSAWEEIDYVARGRIGTVLDFGWAVYEGDSGYDSSRTLDPRGPYVRPVEVYSHDEGCSVTGGFVYRGKGAPALVGRYFYGDYCSGTIWTLKILDGKATDVRRESFRIPGLTSFGEDARGGLYAVNEGGTVFRIASENARFSFAVAGLCPGAAGLRGSPAPDLRPGLAQCGICERGQRLVQGAELVDDRREALARVEPAVQLVDLGGQAVEPLEQGLQLAVAYLLALHVFDCRSRKTPASTPAASIATSRSAACRPWTKCWCNSSVAA